MTVTWASASARANRNDMPAIAVKVWWMLDRRERPNAVVTAWRMAEWPESGVPQWLWGQMFEDACDRDPDMYLADGEVVNRAEHLAGIANPDDTITLYRGAIEDRKFGMSWTTNPERAVWFARRFEDRRDDKGGRVWKADVPVEMVLAHITGRGEDEYVVSVGEMPEPKDVTAEFIGTSA